MPAKWEDLASDKRTRIASSIPSEWKIDTSSSPDNVLSVPKSCGLLSSQELEITESSAVDLVARLAKGELKSYDVTLAFCKRAAVATQLCNIALEFFPEVALKQAKELDEYYEKNGKVVGPLHGLPISLKDQLRVKGVECSMGYVAWLNQYDTEDSALTAVLRRAGAVFYVKTSVPQSLMVCETFNNIIGRTTNPRNKNWSCGGSSGGEGANVALRGGIIGVGTDIGGSIRVPSAFNFLYGLRGSHGRLPYAGMANSMQGQETVHSVVGPIAHSVADLRLFTKSVLAGQPWNYDSKVIPMPWRQSEEDTITFKISSKDLTLGIFNCDGVVLPHPPILRGIQTVRTTLEKAGHNIVDWTPYKHEYAYNLINSIYAGDGGADIHGVLQESGEPAIPNINDLVRPDIKAVSIPELWEVQRQKWAYQCEYLTQWRAMEEKLGKEMDAIICPITPTAAIRHNQFKYYGYASVINLLDFTSVVVPVTFADKAKDGKDAGFKALGDMDALVQGEYDAEAYDGAPVAVQIVGKRLSEERILAIAEEVGRLLGNEVTP